ncbi:MAG: AAA family ATPase [Octadecabacter sp.]
MKRPKFLDWAKHPDALPGLPTGAASGIAVLDIDRKKDKDGFKALKRAGLHKVAKSSHTPDTPSGGQHVYFAHVDGLRCSTSKVADGVDVRADGGYVIVRDPAIPNNLKPFPKKLHKLAGKRTTTTTPQPTEPTAPWKIVKAALKAIPNNGQGADVSRDWWIKILAALHHESGGSEKGLRLAHKWSDRHPSADPDQTDHAWQSFGNGPSKATGATILHEARDHGWDDPRILGRFHDLDAGLEAKNDAKGRLTFLTPEQCVETDPRPYLVKGMLAEADVGCIVGAPGVGKSVLAPALAYAVAQGEQFHGRRVAQGKAFYVAAEDEHGMRGRVHALYKDRGMADAFTLVGGVTDLLNEDVRGKGSPDYRALCRAVEDQRPSLIVIDTLAMAFPGLEENSAEAMGRVVAVARSLTKWGAAVILVHHDTKDGAQGLPRGHSLLNGALDMSLHLTKGDDGVVLARLTKNRNGTSDQSLAFEIKGERIGVDQDGDTVTAALCIESKASAPVTKLSGSAKAALDLMRDMADEDGEVSETEWRVAANEDRSISAAEKERDRKKAATRALQTLSRVGRISAVEGTICIEGSSLPEIDFPDLEAEQ